MQVSVVAHVLKLSSSKTKVEKPRPKTRAWWLEKGRTEQTMELYGGGGDACTVDDYQELVLQFCFVTLFGAAFPLMGMLALISNFIEIYIDSYKLCYTMQRPLAQRSASIPHTWMIILKVVAVLSVLTNIIIVFENSPIFCDFVGLFFLKVLDLVSFIQYMY
jgi:hypothetical protein